MRMLRNVHERVVEAPAEVVGDLLGRLSSPDDPLSPSPAWPPILFDGPLAVGADGGHGFVRYSVGAYDPGRSIRFDFTPPDNGHHALEIEPLAADRCRVRHVLEQQQGWKAALTWSLAISPMHDTYVEELLDNITRAATPSAALRSARPSRRSRLLHRLIWERPTAVEVSPDAALAHQAFPHPDFSDAWQLPLAPGMPRDPHAWSGVLPFPVRATAPHELLLGEDASHLDFRASVLIVDDKVTLTTVVKTHNRRGRLYFAVVRRFHPFMSRTMLRRTHRRLAFAAPSAAERVMSLEQEEST
ncbi:DUF2867 domain-containing protein [Streptomyces sp. NBC_01142]|uniref:DUF2867 domain-containing protein n=1 Tax=Streptomyces sp. NBC_01142 TaxID=2975865 RepID=UPI002257D70F|nr:DUF2867 domain-containing protein [Streptomyces sp. NBC_01142]MCX4819377.1 DUF2867 domain-containing protein [Streptomyces sp. NBC_01142]